MWLLQIGVEEKNGWWLFLVVAAMVTVEWDELYSGCGGGEDLVVGCDSCLIGGDGGSTSIGFGSNMLERQ